jgi:O-acetyl-ADP-ribose deacetylase
LIKRDKEKAMEEKSITTQENRIRIKLGDITQLKVDAIVNAANTSLMGGGGVDGAIHRAGGSAILEECKKLGGCKTGDAVITTAGKLPANYVIHTVGPVWRGGDHLENELLLSCYQRSLELARKHHIASIAFPGISTGVYGFPPDRAVELVLPFLLAYTKEYPMPKEIILVAFNQEAFDKYAQFFLEWKSNTIYEKGARKYHAVLKRLAE